MNLNEQNRHFSSSESRALLLREKLIFAADAGSLILLQKLGVVHRLARACTFQITPAVKHELARGASAADWQIFRDCTTVIDADMIDASDLPVSLSPADAGVLALFAATTADAVLSDDKAILNYCKKQNIPHYCGLSLFALLVQCDLLRADEAATLFSGLSRIGRYSARVIRIAENMLSQARRGELPLPARR